MSRLITWWYTLINKKPYSGRSAEAWWCLCALQHLPIWFENIRNFLMQHNSGLTKCTQLLTASHDCSYSFLLGRWESRKHNTCLCYPSLSNATHHYPMLPIIIWCCPSLSSAGRKKPSFASSTAKEQFAFSFWFMCVPPPFFFVISMNEIWLHCKQNHLSFFSPDWEAVWNSNKVRYKILTDNPADTLSPMP